MTATTDASPANQSTETQVLAFTLGEQDYCVGIDYISEIVDGDELTPLPETDAHIEGVMHLRGRTTTIVNPCEVLETDTSDVVTDGGRTDHRIVVLDSEATDGETPTGWLVSDVTEVKTVADELVDPEPIGGSTHLRGLVTEDDGFMIWLNPLELVA